MCVRKSDQACSSMTRQIYSPDGASRQLGWRSNDGDWFAHETHVSERVLAISSRALHQISYCTNCVCPSQAGSVASSATGAGQKLLSKAQCSISA